MRWTLGFSLLLMIGTSLAAAHEQNLEGSEWGVVGDQGENARFVTFAGSGRVFGFAGCNRFSGTYMQHAEQLTISPLASTRKACPPDVMTQEAEFFDMLSKVRAIKHDHVLLLLLDEKGADIRALQRRDPD